jgi:hypothetical protein
MAKKNTAPNQRRYDVRMIRDFLEHLMWEVRIREYEKKTGDPMNINPEFVEQLRIYMRRYHCLCLMPVNILDNDLNTPEEFAEAMQNFRKYLQSSMEGFVAAMEEFWPLFEQAFESAQVPYAEGIVPQKHYKASDFLTSEEDV